MKVLFVLLLELLGEKAFFFYIGVNQEWNLEQLENNMYKEPT